MTAADIISPNFEWLGLCGSIINEGQSFSPRGQPILELPHETVTIPLDRSVISIGRRKLNYEFMAAEAFWILTGRRDLAFLTQYNKKMAEFSDDGMTLYGAYGPRYVGQREYVVGKLLQDRDTRQATLTLWRVNPMPSKDIPCTVAMDFKIRNGVLNAHVFMRSSDVWLGLPYDFFTFSMIALDILHAYNSRPNGTDPEDHQVAPGLLYITAASSHLYERNLDRVREVIDDPQSWVAMRAPPWLYTITGLGPQRALEDILEGRRSAWWNA
jgi:thymidylate synthase